MTEDEFNTNMSLIAESVVELIGAVAERYGIGLVPAAVLIANATPAAVVSTVVAAAQEDPQQGPWVDEIRARIGDEMDTMWQEAWAAIDAPVDAAPAGADPANG